MQSDLQFIQCAVVVMFDWLVRSIFFFIFWFDLVERNKLTLCNYNRLSQQTNKKGRERLTHQMVDPFDDCRQISTTLWESQVSILYTHTHTLNKCQWNCIVLYSLNFHLNRSIVILFFSLKFGIDCFTRMTSIRIYLYRLTVDGLSGSRNKSISSNKSNGTHTHTSKLKYVH